MSTALPPMQHATARELFGIESDLLVPVRARSAEHEEHDEHVPEVDAAYRFDRETTLALLAGFMHNRRVLVQGLHGTGKSTHVEQVAGLSDADLGGMAHGVQSLVPQDKALIRVTVTVSADGTSTDYDARALQAFATGSSVGVAPLGGSLAPGRLQAHGQIEGSLSYVVPRTTSQLVLRAGRLPRAVPLLRIDDGPATTSHDHAGAPGNGTPSPHQP